MKRTLIFAALAAVASPAMAVSLDAEVTRVGAGIASTNGTVDAYRIELTNPNALPATSVELRLPGSYVQATESARDQAVFAADGSSSMADTFVVAPAGFTAADLLLADLTDDASTLSLGYTIDGGGAIVGAGSSGMAALLAVPAGTSIDAGLFSGFAVTGNVGDDAADTLESINFTLGAPLLAGDFDGNGSVGSGDLDLLLLNFGSAVPPLPAGWDGAIPTPGGIGSDELDALLLTFGQGSATAVPEPTAVVLGLIGLASLGYRRR